MKAILSKRAERMLADPANYDALREAIARKAFGGKKAKLVEMVIRERNGDKIERKTYYLHSLTRRA